MTTLQSIMGNLILSEEHHAQRLTVSRRYLVIKINNKSRVITSSDYMMKWSGIAMRTEIMEDVYDALYCDIFVFIKFDLGATGRSR